MMTDGVLDALPAMREEETMKEIIMDIMKRDSQGDEPEDSGAGAGIQRLLRQG